MKPIQFSLSFQFKGNRNYVHGTDVYTSLIKKLDEQGFQSLSHFELTFRKISNKNQICMITDKLPEIEKNRVFATFSYFLNQKKFYGVLSENDSSSVTDRYVFDENIITSKCHLDQINKLLELNFELPFSVIDTIIAMSKHYLISTRNETGNWFFRTIKLETIPGKNYTHIVVKEDSARTNLVNVKYFVDDLFIGTGTAALVK